MLHFCEFFSAFQTIHTEHFSFSASLCEQLKLQICFQFSPALSTIGCINKITLWWCIWNWSFISMQSAGNTWVKSFHLWCYSASVKVTSLMWSILTAYKFFVRWGRLAQLLLISNTRTCRLCYVPELTGLLKQLLMCFK